MWHLIFSISLTGSKFNENMKNDQTFNNKLLMILKTVFIISVIDLSTKNKMLRRGFVFLQKSKIQTVGKRKKLFSVISFQKFLNFPVWIFLENVQCSPELSFQEASWCCMCIFCKFHLTNVGLLQYLDFPYLYYVLREKLFPKFQEKLVFLTFKLSLNQFFVS